MAGALKARGVEALIGAVLGSGAGLASGAATFQTAEPAEWSDEHGYVYSRPLTTQEKEQRRRYLARAALLGAGVGTGGSLMAGGVRRHLLARREAKDAPQHFRQMFEGFSNVAREYEQRAATPRVAGAAGGGLRGPVEAFRRRQADTAKTLLEQQEDALREALKGAKGARRKRAFGGVQWGVKKKPKDTGGRVSGKMFHPKTTAVGRMGTHFQALKQEHGKMSPLTTETKDAEKFFRDLIDRTMEKQSAAVTENFLLETQRIVEVSCGQ